MVRIRPPPVTVKKVKGAGSSPSFKAPDSQAVPRGADSVRFRNEQTYEANIKRLMVLVESKQAALERARDAFNTELPNVKRALHDLQADIYDDLAVVGLLKDGLQASSKLGDSCAKRFSIICLTR